MTANNLEVHSSVQLSEMEESQQEVTTPGCHNPSRKRSIETVGKRSKFSNVFQKTKQKNLQLEIDFPTTTAQRQDDQRVGKQAETTWSVKSFPASVCLRIHTSGKVSGHSMDHCNSSNEAAVAVCWASKVFDVLTMGEDGKLSGCCACGLTIMWTHHVQSVCNKVRIQLSSKATCLPLALRKPL